MSVLPSDNILGFELEERIDLDILQDEGYLRVEQKGVHHWWVLCHILLLLALH